MVSGHLHSSSSFFASDLGLSKHGVGTYVDSRGFSQDSALSVRCIRDYSSEQMGMDFTDDLEFESLILEYSAG